MEARGTLHSWFPLIDSNILVYRFDARYPDKQRVARELLRKGVLQDSVRVPHQAIVEFMAVVTRLTPERRPLLSAGEARRETEELLTQFEVLYPNEALVRTALRGAAAYQLSWFDAHLWAYAEHYGLAELISEDFEHDRLYGSVRAKSVPLICPTSIITRSALQDALNEGCSLPSACRPLFVVFCLPSSGPMLRQSSYRPAPASRRPRSCR